MENKIKRIAAAAMTLTLMGTGGAVSQVVSPSGCTGVTAFAATTEYNYIDVRTDPLKTRIKTDDGVILDPEKEDIVALSFTITNNTGIVHFCGNCNYDSSKLEIIINESTGKPAHTLGEVGYKYVNGDREKINVGWKVTLNEDIEDQFKDPKFKYYKGYSGMIGLASYTPERKKDVEELTKDGIVMTFYLKSKINPKSNRPYTDDESLANMIASPSMDKVLDKNMDSVDYKIPEEIKMIGDATPPKNVTIKKKELICTYKRGDVNNDGRIDIADAQKIINMYKANNKKQIIVNLDYNLYSADVNNDGYINMDDADIVFDYYMDKYVSKLNEKVLKSKYKFGEWKNPEYVYAYTTSAK